MGIRSKVGKRASSEPVVEWGCLVVLATMARLLSIDKE